MKKKLKILMIDDHPMIIEGYQNSLLSLQNDELELVIDSAVNCDESIKVLKKALKSKLPYELVFLDISLPASKDGEYESGIDLAKWIITNSPETKIILLTMFDESYRIHSIVKNINPAGFLIKSDVTASELSIAFYRVLNNPPYYSVSVQTTIDKTIFHKIDVDEVNHQILHLLSKGVKTKDINKYIDFSLSAIEKRKKHLKEIFGVKEGSDTNLLTEARAKGFID
jgi:DNA-binding NarL/FixJ family response regulator